MSVTLAKRNIAALQTLQGVGTRATLTDAERNTLAGWSGWGPLAPALNPNPEGPWAAIADSLNDYFDASPELDIGARSAVDTAFYTPDWLMDSMWTILTEAGFDGGNVLEPGCGSGNFMSRAPAGLHVNFTGVEKDATSARIAALLNPDARIINAPLQAATFGTTKFDAVIGNVPFGTGHVNDGAERSWYHSSLHHYFVGRSLQQTRPGGYLALITSRYLMDSETFNLNVDGTQATLIGAVRLPTGTFRGEGTDVVADVVVLRRDGDEHVPSPTRKLEWVGNFTFRSDDTRVSSYWGEHPEMVAGVMTPGNHHMRSLVVTSTNVRGDAKRAFSALTDEVHDHPMGVPPVPALDVDLPLCDVEGRPEGSFYELPDGAVMCVKDGNSVPVLKVSRELRALVQLKGAAEALLGAESDWDAPDETITPARENARRVWEAYVKTYGPLNRGTLHEGKVDEDTGLPALTWRRPTLGGFRSDPAYSIVMALEVYDPESGEASPAPILLRRVNRKPEPVTSASTAAEALSVSLGEAGRVSLPRIASLLGLDSDGDAERALGNLVFRDPDGDVVLARTYLSGNVRAKLADAEKKAARDTSYQRNVDALRKVVPPLLGPTEIKASLGVSWVSATDVTQFLHEVVGGRAEVTHVPSTASWSVDAKHSVSAEATTTYGTSAMNAYEIVRDLLNGRTPTVYQEIQVDGKTKKVRDQEQTVAVQEKATLLQERFATWVWEDKGRADRLIALYNRRFNSYVVRAADGSHLKFHGMSTDRPLWEWQRNMVDRITTTGASLCAHAVGSGKTLTAVASVMTLRQFGLVNKPLLVVPNHLLEQIAREARQAYPMGKFLIAGQEDLAGDKRRLFAARCATGDWDAVVVTHAGFTSIPVHSRTEIAFVDQQIGLLRDAQIQASRTIRWEDRTENGSRYETSKMLSRRIRSLENQLTKLRAKRNDPGTVLFEQLGVDFLAVDEAHMFKRLALGPTSGFSMGTSKRATDLYLKMRMLDDRSEGRPYAALFTGTPWTNTLAETWVWQTYLQPEVLAEAGVTSLDAWQAQFVRSETKVEVSPDGATFRMSTRPTALVNVPELRTMLSLNADVLPAAHIPLVRPDKNSETVVCRPSAAQRNYVASLVDRADRLARGGSDKSDNMLRICGEGRRVALDPMLVNVNGAAPKVTAVAKRTAALYKANVDRLYGDSGTPGAFQVVFCDMGTPGASSNQTYGRLRDALIREGVPAQSIRWIHDAKTDKAKDALFAACRDGSVSVLIGSTEKMGYGTNVQRRLIAVHHMDAPWRPSDVEQRDGRALRPGNLNSEVDVIRYVVEGTFDAYMWQTLERKAFFVQQMMTVDSTVREVEDISDAILDFTQVKALATGNPELLELAKWREEARRLRTLKAVDRQSLNASLAEAKDAERAATKAKATVEALTAMIGNPSWKDTDESEWSWFASEAHRLPSKEKNGYYSSYLSASLAWRGVMLIVEKDGYDSSAPWQLTVRQYRHSLTVFTATLNAAKLTRSPKSAETLLRGLATEWYEQAEDQRDRLRAQVAEWRKRAESARTAVESYSFAGEERLAEVEAKIRDLQQVMFEAAEGAEKAPEEAA